MKNDLRTPTFSQVIHHVLGDGSNLIITKQYDFANLGDDPKRLYYVRNDDIRERLKAENITERCSKVRLR